MTKEYFKIAYRNLKARSLRSWLTILGIVIGVFLVVSLVSLAQGVAQSIEDELQSIGGDIIVVMPGEGFDLTSLIGGAQLEEQDLQAIERARGVETVIETPWTAQTGRHRDTSKNVMLLGVDYVEGLPFLQDLVGWSVVEGEFPRPGRREALVGNMVPNDVFSDLRIGDDITFSGRSFEVSGILRSLGNRQDDTSIILDLQDYREVTGTREGAQVAMVQIAEGHELDVVVENIERELDGSTRRVRGQDSESSFNVITSDAAADVAGNVMLILQLSDFAFASIAVLVGAIGIMNSMFTSVRERTKEIGILKAVGAKRRHITSIFLVESGMIGLFGGTIGVILGIGAAKVAEIFVRDAHPVIYIEAHVSFTLVAGALLFSFLIGCLSGFLPAREAAKKQPVDALRYE